MTSHLPRRHCATELYPNPEVLSCQELPICHFCSLKARPCCFVHSRSVILVCGIIQLPRSTCLKSTVFAHVVYLDSPNLGLSGATRSFLVMQPQLFAFGLSRQSRKHKSVPQTFLLVLNNWLLSGWPTKPPESEVNLDLQTWSLWLSRNHWLPPPMVVCYHWFSDSAQ